MAITSIYESFGHRHTRCGIARLQNEPSWIPCIRVDAEIAGLLRAEGIDPDTVNRAYVPTTASRWTTFTGLFVLTDEQHGALFESDEHPGTEQAWEESNTAMCYAGIGEVDIPLHGAPIWKRALATSTYKDTLWVVQFVDMRYWMQSASTTTDQVPADNDFRWAYDQINRSDQNPLPPMKAYHPHVWSGTPAGSVDPWWPRLLCLDEGMYHIDMDDVLGGDEVFGATPRQCIWNKCFWPSRLIVPSPVDPGQEGYIAELDDPLFIRDLQITGNSASDFLDYILKACGLMLLPIVSPTPDFDVDDGPKGQWYSGNQYRPEDDRYLYRVVRIGEGYKEANHVFDEMSGSVKSGGINWVRTHEKEFGDVGYGEGVWPVRPTTWPVSVIWHDQDPLPVPESIRTSMLDGAFQLTPVGANADSLRLIQTQSVRVNTECKYPHYTIYEIHPDIGNVTRYGSVRISGDSHNHKEITDHLPIPGHAIETWPDPEAQEFWKALLAVRMLLLARIYTDRFRSATGDISWHGCRFVQPWTGALHMEWCWRDDGPYTRAWGDYRDEAYGWPDDDRNTSQALHAAGVQRALKRADGSLLLANRLTHTIQLFLGSVKASTEDPDVEGGRLYLVSPLQPGGVWVLKGRPMRDFDPEKVTYNAAPVGSFCVVGVDLSYQPPDPDDIDTSDPDWDNWETSEHVMLIVDEDIETKQCPGGGKGAKSAAQELPPATSKLDVYRMHGAY